MAQTRTLTPRERQVLVLAANGLSDTAIGRSLAVSRSTVRRHLQNAFATLGVRDRTQAVAVALLLGEFPLAEVRCPAGLASVPAPP